MNEKGEKIDKYIVETSSGGGSKADQTVASKGAPGKPGAKVDQKKVGDVRDSVRNIGESFNLEGLEKKTEPRKLIQLNNYIVLGVPFVKFG